MYGVLHYEGARICIQATSLVRSVHLQMLYGAQYRIISYISLHLAINYYLAVSLYFDQ
jgi:hypothetical protein